MDKEMQTDFNKSISPLNWFNKRRKAPHDLLKRVYSARAIGRSWTPSVWEGVSKCKGKLKHPPQYCYNYWRAFLSIWIYSDTPTRPKHLNQTLRLSSINLPRKNSANLGQAKKKKEIARLWVAPIGGCKPTHIKKTIAMPINTVYYAR